MTKKAKSQPAAPLPKLELPDFDIGKHPVLGLDLGKHTGWAVRYPDDTLVSGFWDLERCENRRFEGGGMIFVRFRNLLRVLIDQTGARLVTYEGVTFHRSNASAVIYGGWVSQLTSLCEDLALPYAALPPSTIKLIATGHGGCEKTWMQRAAAEYWPDWTAGRAPDDLQEDEVDARWVCFVGAIQAGARLPMPKAQPIPPHQHKVKKSRVK